MDSEDTETDGKTNVCPLYKEIKKAIEDNSRPFVSDPTPCGNYIQIIRNDDSSGKIYQQFTIVENAGAGECLFLSVLNFLNNNIDRFNNIPKTATELRRRTVNYILSMSSDGSHLNFDRFRDSIIINLRNHIPGMTNTLELNGSDEALQTAYFNYMSSYGVFATATELCAMSELFGFEFYVIQRTSGSDFSCYDYGSEFNENDTTMHLLFTGSAEGGHFRLIIPSNTPSSTAIPTGTYKLVDDHTSSRMTSIMLLAEFTELPPGSTPDDHNSSIPDSQSLQDTDLENFLKDLSRCRRFIKVIKRIPRAARISAAFKLASVSKLKTGTSTTNLANNLTDVHKITEKNRVLFSGTSKKLTEYFGCNKKGGSLIDPDYLLSRRLAILCARSLISYNAVSSSSVAFTDFLKAYKIVLN
ncbi:hypothetical protein Bhyg_03121, partial [Pseudolycoriella hygida]